MSEQPDAPRFTIGQKVVIARNVFHPRGSDPFGRRVAVIAAQWFQTNSRHTKSPRTWEYTLRLVDDRNGCISRYEEELELWQSGLDVMLELI